MKRFLIPILALVVLLASIASVSASPSQTVLAPIVLTPGDSQPITCQYALVGTLASPACPTATVTSTATATATATATPAPGNTNSFLNPYTQIRVSCLNGATPIDSGVVAGVVTVGCPASTPTAVATATSTVTPSATPTP